MTHSELLKQHTDLLLSETSHWGERRESLQQMHEIFIELNSINAKGFDQQGNAVWLENGYAVSPIAAALCLFEIVRTRLFVKGLIDAIRHLLKTETERPVQVFDAGCGPYALLSLLAAQYFSAEEVQFNLLDIHETNISSAEQLIQSLGMQDKFGDYIIGDACTFQWPSSIPLHIVISETMLNALRKEPQVAITINLARQLSDNGILIPSKIEVDLVQIDPKKDQEVKQKAIDTMDTEPYNYSLYESKIANIITLAKDTTGSIQKKPVSVVTLPSHHDHTFHHLEMHTHITVFGEHNMHHADSSITAPFAFSNPAKNPLQAGTTILFHYNVHKEPGIVYELA